MYRATEMCSSKLSRVCENMAGAKTAGQVSVEDEVNKRCTAGLNWAAPCLVSGEDDKNEPCLRYVTEKGSSFFPIRDGTRIDWSPTSDQK